MSANEGALVKNWTQEETEAWLTRNPLPPDFEWEGRRVLPQYRLHKGYGFWLRTTPYHRGLFGEVHDLLLWRVMRDEPMPDVAELDEALRGRAAAARAQMSLFPGDSQKEAQEGTKTGDGV